jgi:phospholipase/carboxylesterase
MGMEIDGPRLPPASGGPARRLVVLVHGYGADGNDLIALGNEWRRVLPDAAFVAPHAPEPCGMAGPGFQWFPLSMGDPAVTFRGVSSAGPALDAFLDRELERHGLGPGDLALVGFSQGTMMSLHVGLRRSVAPAAIVGYSGLLAGAEHLEEDIRVRPPVLLVHGDRDELIPFQAMFAAAQALAGADVGVEWHLSRGVGHGIDPEGLALGGRFIARAFGEAAGGGM